MAKTKSTQTTRNKAFNDYDFLYTDKSIIRASALSTVANTKRGVQNIRLLDMTDAVIKNGSEIFADALNNTTMIELNTGLGANEAKKLAQTVSMLSPYVDEHGVIDDDAPDEIKSIFVVVQTSLKAAGTTFNAIRNMIIDYSGLFENDKNYDIYGAPDKIVLNNRQNYNNCGVESTLNLLAVAGIIKMNENLKDQKSVEKTFLTSILERGLAEDSGELGIVDEPDGGTFPDDYRDILKYFGINSTAYFMSSKADGNVYKDINEFAYKISQGHGAVLGVCSTYLWNEQKSETNKIGIDHAIAITGVVYESGTEPAITDDDGNITGYSTPVGFYIHDSGAWMTRFISLEDFKKATLYDQQGIDPNEANYNKNLHGHDAKTGADVGKEAGGFFTTITDSQIKSATFNLNATGDKYDNMIWGNNAENEIKGMNGNDTLYGNSGNDTIRGGNGNDIIVGNNVSATDLSIFKDYVDDATKEKLSAIETSATVQRGINDIYGDAGNDIIIGGLDADLIYAGNGNDYIYTGDGRNAVYGGAGNDVIIGGFDNDRLFGEAGNDYIYGFADDDTIDGGAGNDHLYGNGGDDRIETGKGNDIVYFEGQEHGDDVISSKAGSTTLKFIDIDADTEIPSFMGKKASDMFFTFTSNTDNSKFYDLDIVYSPKEKLEGQSVEFQKFYNIRNGKFSSVSLVDKNNDLYTISSSNKTNVSVANTKMEGTTKISGVKTENSKINNILLTTNASGTNITTSVKNDIVTMVNSGNTYDKSYDDEKIVDTIFYGDVSKIGDNRPAGYEYQGGYDKYVSEERNTKYVVDFSKYTTLSVFDNVKGLTRIVFDDNYKNSSKNTNAVSTHDCLQLMSDIGHVEFFFDVAINGDEKPVTTVNNQLFVLYKDYYSGSDSVAKHTQIANNRENSQGFVYMDTFFGAKDTIIAAGTGEIPEYNFFGNGRIETLELDVATAQGETQAKYNYFEADLVTIAGQVADWLSSDANTEDYKSAFDAFSKAAQDEVDISGLVAAYATPDHAV